MAIPRIPLRTDPWPIGAHAPRPCPICGKHWRPWAGSVLPCHARCLFDADGVRAILEHPGTNAAAARAYGLTDGVLRSLRRRAG